MGHAYGLTSIAAMGDDVVFVDSLALFHMTHRYALRDDQWERIEHLLPGRKGHVEVTARDNRLFVKAVLYRYRAGIPWRYLPERLGDFRVVHTRLSRWSRTGGWKRVFQALAHHADEE